jgi:acyl-CoA synthetase (AMP-forming)/AMP-acid ligase II
VPTTLTELLRERAQAEPDRVPVVHIPADPAAGDERLTTAELDAAARGVARRLQDSVRARDRVLLCFPGGTEFAVAFFGCLYANVIPVPVPPPFPGAMAERFAHIVSDCGPQMVLTVTSLAPLLGTMPLPVLTTEDAASGEGVALPSQDPSGIAYLQYSGGSTGAPRGVIVTHSAALAQLAEIEMLAAVSPGEVTVGWLPMFHDLGLHSQLLHPVYSSFRNAALDPAAFAVDPGRWLTELSQRRACAGSAPAFAYELLLRRVPASRRGQLDLSHWRTAYFGAEVLDPDAMTAFADGFAVAGFRAEAVRPGYGMAESVMAVAMRAAGTGHVALEADREALKDGRLTPGAGFRIASSGQVCPSVTAVIADRHTREALPVGRIGEIFIAGSHVTPGYWGRPDPYVEVDGNRMLPTGDLGAFLDGELYVLGRSADLIVVDGQWHLPDDIERTVTRANPGSRARTCTAVLAPDGLVIAVESSAEAAPEELARAATDAVVREHGLKPRRVVILDRGGISLTTSGKRRRADFLAAYMSGSLQGQERGTNE